MLAIQLRRVCVTMLTLGKIQKTWAEIMKYKIEHVT